MQFNIFGIDELYLNNNERNGMQIDSEYMNIYFLYRKLFTQYIIEILNLIKYDKQIVNNKIKFPIVNQKNMDIYQYFSSDILKYFYIRNNIYIKKLNEDEIKFLKNIKFNDNKVLNSEEKEFIENTYAKVIFEDVLGNGEKCITFFGPNSRNFWAKNNSLVIGIRYDEFTDNGLSDDEWDILHEKQIEFLNKLIDKMIVEYNKKLKIPVSIIRYNEFSVRKLYNEKNVEEER